MFGVEIKITAPEDTLFGVVVAVVATVLVLTRVCGVRHGLALELTCALIAYSIGTLAGTERNAPRTCNTSKGVADEGVSRLLQSFFSTTPSTASRHAKDDVCQNWTTKAPA
jgi:hypothetical protein